jgi:hypothetical protein
MMSTATTATTTITGDVALQCRDDSTWLNIATVGFHGGIHFLARAVG